MDYDRPRWHQYAACRGKPTSWFFPEKGDSVGKAKLVCAGCPVAAPCLEQALAGEEHGVWAGTSRGTRRRIMRDRIMRDVA